MGSTTLLFAALPAFTRTTTFAGSTSIGGGSAAATKNGVRDSSELQWLVMLAPTKHILEYAIDLLEVYIYFSTECR